MQVLIRAAIAIALPVAVFFGGGQLMLAMTGASEARAAAPKVPPLNQRWSGYTSDDVVKLWGNPAFDRQVERRLLEVDLAFPFAYGGALAISLLLVWAALGRPFNPAWVLLPVVAGMLADWTENLVQLQQLQRFSRGGAAVVDAGWIAVASVATMVKLAALGIATVLLLALIVLMFARVRASA